MPRTALLPFKPPTRPLTYYFDAVAYGLEPRLPLSRPCCGVKVRVQPDECQGVVESASGQPLNWVELPQPGPTFFLLRAYCRHERLAVTDVRLNLEARLTRKRRRAAVRAYASFIWREFKTRRAA